jgi:hypothetical protein
LEVDTFEVPGKAPPGWLNIQARAQLPDPARVDIAGAIAMKAARRNKQGQTLMALP